MGANERWENTKERERKRKKKERETRRIVVCESRGIERNWRSRRFENYFREFNKREDTGWKGDRVEGGRGENIGEKF